MARITWWILSARIVQILIGCAVMGISIVLCAFDGTQGNATAIVSSLLGAGIAVSGCCGLFAMNSPAGSRLLYLLVLFIDTWALIMCTSAASILMIIATNDFYYFDSGYEYAPYLAFSGQGAAIAAAAISFVGILVILVPMTRTLHWWRLGRLHHAPPNSKSTIDEDETRHSSYISETPAHPPHYYQSTLPELKATETQAAGHGYGRKSGVSPRPVPIAETTAHWSTFSKSPTLTSADTKELSRVKVGARV